MRNPKKSYQNIKTPNNNKLAPDSTWEFGFKWIIANKIVWRQRERKKKKETSVTGSKETNVRPKLGN